MAALVAADVALYPAAGNSATNSRPNEWFPTQNRNIIARSLVINLAQGGQTNTIGAAALGLSVILGCSNLFDDTNNKGYLAAVDPVTNTIILFDGAAAPAPVDVTAAACYITVWGTQKIPAA